MSKKGVKIIQRYGESFEEECIRSFIWDYKNKAERFLSGSYYRDIFSIDYCNAFDRMMEELKVVRKNGYIYQYCVAKMVQDYCIRHNKLACPMGNAANSFLSFLYGITDPYIDPLEMELSTNMLFGLHMEREPVFIIAISPGFSQKIIRYLYKRFGKHAVSINGYGGVMVSVKYDSKMIHTSLVLVEDPFVEAAEEYLNKYSRDFSHFVWEKFAFSGFPNKELDDRERNVFIRFIETADNVDEEIRKDSELFSDSALGKSFDSLVTAIGIVKGKRIWPNFIHSKQKNTKLLYTNRDDVYTYCLSLTGNAESAYSVMDNVRKGKGLSKKIKQQFPDPSLADELAALWDGVYMPFKGTCLMYAKLICYIASELK